MPSFEYFTTVLVNAELEIDDIGNCAIIASNDMGENYCLIIETRLGVTRILNYGPSIIDFDSLPKSVNCSFKRIDYNPTKISKTIREFLNNPYHKITSAKQVGKEEALNVCKDMLNYMKQENFW